MAADADRVALFEIKVEIPPAQAERADAVLLEQAAENWSVFHEVVVQRAWVIGIGADEAEARKQWAGLAPGLAAVGVVPVAEPVGRMLADADWRESYKAHFHAWRFGRLHWVPVWERGTYAVPGGEAVLWLDPGLAFGTGNHETTRLCVERLVAWAGTHGVDGRLIDAGCGSGILALSAAVLGFREIVGFDCDPEAIRVSEANAVLNGLGGRVRFGVADVAVGLAGGAADLVLANIQADVLMRHARELTGAVAPGGALVLSGILANENAAVRAAFASVVPPWTAESRTMGEWSDLLLVRPA